MSDKDAVEVLREQIRLAEKAYTSNIIARIPTLESVLDELERLRAIARHTHKVFYHNYAIFAYEDGWLIQKMVGVVDNKPVFEDFADGFNSVEEAWSALELYLANAKDQTK